MPYNLPMFRFTSPRTTVEVHLPDKRVIEGPRGATAGNFLKLLESESQEAPIVGAVINGELRELTFPIQIDSRIRPVSMSESDGMLIYRRSLIFLLDAAFGELFPGAVLTVDHSVSSGGYFCQVSDPTLLTAENLSNLSKKMHELVNADLPFSKREVALKEAIAYFQTKGYQDKVNLLAHRKKDYLVLYRLGDHQDYHHGYMVPSTGYLRWFDLELTDNSFTLRFPRRHRPTEIQAMPRYSKLLDTFRQYSDWLDQLGIANIGALDTAIQSGSIREVILASEALHEQHVAHIAGVIATQKRARTVLVAGPSSSGKTTFAKRLSIQLISRGITPFPLEMDNYFVERDKTPPGEDGKPDFESIRALDCKLLGEDLRHLITGEQIQLPHYNFHTGKREAGDIVQLQPGQIVILEGIHGLNPELLSNLPSEQTYRIYVSCLTQLNLDRHNRISTTDTRLLRRIVRDARDRGYSAQGTIARWESVGRGEKRYIFPYQENANVMFNSALAYELAAIKPLAEPLLRQVPYGTNEYIEAKRLLSLLEWFLPLNTDLLPDNSILREFVGGSILKGFKLWKGT